MGISAADVVPEDFIHLITISDLNRRIMLGIEAVATSISDRQLYLGDEWQTAAFCMLIPGKRTLRLQMNTPPPHKTSE